MRIRGCVSLATTLQRPPPLSCLLSPNEIRWCKGSSGSVNSYTRQRVRQRCSWERHNEWDKLVQALSIIENVNMGETEAPSRFSDQTEAFELCCLFQTEATVNNLCFRPPTTYICRVYILGFKWCHLTLNYLWKWLTQFPLRYFSQGCTPVRAENNVKLIMTLKAATINFIYHCNASNNYT